MRTETVAAWTGCTARPTDCVFVIVNDLSLGTVLARLAEANGLHAEIFASAQAFLKSSPVPEGPGCIVADLCLPDLDGLALQDALRSTGWPYPVVFLSCHAATPTVVRAMKAGAVDVLEKPVREDELVQVLSEALSRGRAAFHERRSRTELQIRQGALTAREREVFALVTSGMLNKQVAWQLGLSEKTVKVHRARVMEKMRAASLAGLVRMADRLGIGVQGRA